VQECVAAMAMEAKNKKLDITSKIGNTVPNTVQGDRLRVRQTLLNLISNGIKFTETGKVIVEVHLEETSSKKPGDHIFNIRFDVKDTGIGISEKEQQLLFKPFSQVDGSSTRKHKGTGLGLYISKQLVGIMGGTIAIKSNRGRGTECSFVIPLRACAEDQIAVPVELVQLPH
jgi:signal transduction histidine kinase